MSTKAKFITRTGSIDLGYSLEKEDVQQITSNKNDIETLKTWQAATDTTLASHELQLTTHTTEIATINTKITDILTRTSAAETNISSHTESLTNLSNRMDSAETKIDNRLQLSGGTMTGNLIMGTGSMLTFSSGVISAYSGSLDDLYLYVEKEGDSAKGFSYYKYNTLRDNLKTVYDSYYQTKLSSSNKLSWDYVNHPTMNFAKSDFVQSYISGSAIFSLANLISVIGQESFVSFKIRGKSDASANVSFKLLTYYTADKDTYYEIDATKRSTSAYEYDIKLTYVSGGQLKIIFTTINSSTARLINQSGNGSSGSGATPSTNYFRVTYVY